MTMSDATLEDHSIDRHPSRWRALKEQRWWSWVKRGAALAFFVLVAGLIALEAGKIRWHDVIASIRAMPWQPLLIAIALGWTSHAVYSTYDLLGHYYTGHALRKRTVIAVTFASYAFNLNMGFLVGGAGIRLRLYSRLGLALDVITKIVSLSMLTNWLGYMVLAGIVVIIQPVPLPFSWLETAAVRVAAGGLLLLVPAAYVAACGLSRERVLQFRGHRLALPTLRVALFQVLISCVNWLLMAGVIYTLLQQRGSFAAVLCTLLAAAIAGVISHVPAGVGVLEAVFVMLLSGWVPKEELIAVLLTYRGIYYLMPLVVALLMYIVFETRFKRARSNED